jgi:pimeloyl-ACP methyl ester carboxylesterase
VVLETLAHLATVDLTPILPKITTPALVLVGERSTMHTPDRAQSLAALLPRGILVEVRGAVAMSSIPRQPNALRSGASLCDPRAREDWRRVPAPV